jgi:transcriptional regulator with PAS, ATPase and Fis domain
MEGQYPPAGQRPGAMILGDEERIRTESSPSAEVAENLALATKDGLDEALEDYEKIHIENVLTEADGDRPRATKILGVSRSSLISQNRQARNHA